MISATYRNILYGVALIGIVFMIIMPDVLIGLLFELVHFFFEVLFISFEWLESTLDTVVEHLFHTDLHQTQIIVFYLIVGIAVYPAYYLWQMLRRLFFRSKETWLAAQTIWLQYKTSAFSYWQQLSLINKVKFAAISAGIIYLSSFLFM